MWEELESRYGWKRMVSKLGTFNLLMKIKLKASVSMGNHSSTLMLYSSNTASIRSKMEGPLKVVIFLCSLFKRVEYCAMIASVNKMQDERATWNHVTILSLTQHERISQKNKTQ